MGRARWILLARTSFAVFAAGLDIGARPDFALTSNEFQLQFDTQDSFKVYCQSVFRHDPTRLVNFEVTDLSPRRVVCQMIMNLTPKIRVHLPNQPEPDHEGCDVIIRA